jgi:DNA repair protein RadC
MTTIANLELRAKKTPTNFEKVKIVSSKDAFKVISQFYFDDIDIFESFFILCLNRNNQTIAYAKISQGGVSGTVVDIKLIAKYAIDCLASGVILAHNHPSGNLKPSPEDIKITERAREALKILDIQVLDHVILTSDGYYSFGDEGII